VNINAMKNLIKYILRDVDDILNRLLKFYQSTNRSVLSRDHRRTIKSADFIVRLSAV